MALLKKLGWVRYEEEVVSVRPGIQVPPLRFGLFHITTFRQDAHLGENKDTGDRTVVLISHTENITHLLL